MKQPLYKRLTSLMLVFSMIFAMMPAVLADPGAPTITVEVKPDQLTLVAGKSATLLRK